MTQKILVNLILNKSSKYYCHFNTSIEEIAKEISFDVCALASSPIEENKRIKLKRVVEEVNEKEILRFLKESAALVTERELSGKPEYDLVITLFESNVIQHKRLFSIPLLKRLIKEVAAHELHITKESYETLDLIKHFKSNLFITTAGTFRSLVNGYKLTLDEIKSVSALFSFICLRTGIKEVIL